MRPVAPLVISRDEEGELTRLKRDICTNHTYQSMEEMEDAARRYIRNYNKRHKQRDLYYHSNINW